MDETQLEKIELGYTWTGGTPANKDTWTEIWGDGLDFYSYPWDDGNLVNGDGCDSSWNIEPGWAWQFGTNDWADQWWHWHNNPAIISSSINNDIFLFKIYYIIYLYLSFLYKFFYYF